MDKLFSLCVTLGLRSGPRFPCPNGHCLCLAETKRRRGCPHKAGHDGVRIEAVGVTRDPERRAAHEVCILRRYPRKSAKEIFGRFDMVDGGPGGSRVDFCDVGENSLKLCKRARAVGYSHPLRNRLNTAETCSSVATSPRSTSASAARISARSVSLRR